MDPIVEHTDRPGTTEIRIDATERRLDAWHCLMVIVTGVCLTATTGAAAMLLFSGGSIDTLLFAVITFFIVWGVSRVWAIIVLPGVVALALFFVGGLITNEMGLYRANAAPPPFMAWLLFFAGAVAIFGPLLLFAIRVARTPSPEKALIALPKGRTFGLIPALVAVAGIHPVCRELPTRARRVIARVLFFLSQLAIAVSIFMTVFFGAAYLVNMARAFECPTGRFAYCLGQILGSAIGPPALIFLFIGLAAAFRYLARRFSRTSLELVRGHDPRPPILFLRSFSDDQVRLVGPKRNPVAHFILAGAPQPILDHILLEEGTGLGPVIAIGAPGSRPPFGAARIYVTNDEWKDVVSELARASQAVILAVDDTDGIRWELNELHSRNHTPKVLHLLPPRLTMPAEASRVVAAARESSEQIAAQLAPLHRFLLGTTQPCIGWYEGRDGGLVVLTTVRPSEVSYVVAVRTYLRSLKIATAGSS